MAPNTTITGGVNIDTISFAISGEFQSRLLTCVLVMVFVHPSLAHFTQTTLTSQIQFSTLHAMVGYTI